MEDRAKRIRMMRYLGIGFAAAGFVAIALGYHGTARVACVDCQFPYLLSGGAAGIALVVLGIGLLVIAQISAEAVWLRQGLGVADENLLSDVIRLPETDAAEPVVAPGEVVLGRSVYHRADCRLVEGKPGLGRGERAVAVERGLTPCRLCAPEMEPAATNGRTGARRSRGRS